MPREKERTTKRVYSVFSFCSMDVSIDFLPDLWCVLAVGMMINSKKKRDSLKESADVHVGLSASLSEKAVRADVETGE